MPQQESGTADLEAARVALQLSYRAVWIGYFAAGGNGTLDDVTGWLTGAAPVADADHDLLTHALNEHFSARGEDHPLSYVGD